MRFCILKPVSCRPIVIVLIFQLCIFKVSSVINSRHLTFITPTTGRRYIHLEGKFSYSVHLILEKEDKPLQINVTSSPIEYIIRAPEFSYYGVMAIIQSLHFRKSSSGCRDYIQFSPEGNDRLEKSVKICGSLDKYADDSYKPRGLIGPRSYFNFNGSIKMNVYVDPLSKERDNLEGQSESSAIGAEIVFTAYTECPGTEIGLQTLKACSTSTGTFIACIPSTLFCDSKIDCGLENGFGLDEQGCYYPYLYAAIGLLFILLVCLSIYAFVCWVRIKAKQMAITPP